MGATLHLLYLLLSHLPVVPVTDMCSWSLPACFFFHRVLYHLQTRAARQARYWCHPLFSLYPPQVEEGEACLFGRARCGALLVCVEVKDVFLLLVVALSRASSSRPRDDVVGVAFCTRTCVHHSSCIVGGLGCFVVYAPCRPRTVRVSRRHE